jgi:hypothetical protein
MKYWKPKDWKIQKTESGIWIAIQDELGITLEADSEEGIIEAMFEALALLVVDHREGEKKAEERVKELLYGWNRDESCSECGVTDNDGSFCSCEDCNASLCNEHQWRDERLLDGETRCERCHKRLMAFSEMSRDLARSQELLDSTIDQLKRTQDQRDWYLAQMTAALVETEATIESMEAEVDGGVLDPEWCRAHMITLKELRDRFNADAEYQRVRVHPETGHLMDEDGDILLFTKRSEFLLVRAGGTGDAVHPYPTPEETP